MAPPSAKRQRRLVVGSSDDDDDDEDDGDVFVDSKRQTRKPTESIVPSAIQPIKRAVLTKRVFNTSAQHTQQAKQGKRIDRSTTQISAFFSFAGQNAQLTEQSQSTQPNTNIAQSGVDNIEEEDAIEGRIS